MLQVHIYLSYVPYHSISGAAEAQSEKEVFSVSIEEGLSQCQPIQVTMTNSQSFFSVPRHNQTDYDKVMTIRNLLSIFVFPENTTQVQVLIQHKTLTCLLNLDEVYFGQVSSA